MAKYYDPNFYGTSTWWKHSLNRNLLYTDSVKYIADEKQAYWIIDLVASYDFKKYDFLLLTIDVDVVNSSAVFTAKEDIDKECIIRQEIPFTDLNFSVQFYLERADEHYQVLMCPSDH